MWNAKIYLLVVSALMLLAAPIATMAETNSEPMREYQIKAAFLYNFIKFVDWPEEKTADSNEPIIIGVVGKDLFGKAFKPIEVKKVKGRKILIKRFRDLKKSGQQNDAQFHQKIEVIRKCQLLFICVSERENMAEIMDALKDSHVLTIGETAGFLETGGIINFTKEEEKVRFEINLNASGKARLKISSKLLRLAKRVIEEKNASGTTDNENK